MLSRLITPTQHACKNCTCIHNENSADWREEEERSDGWKKENSGEGIEKNGLLCMSRCVCVCVRTHACVRACIGM